MQERESYAGGRDRIKCFAHIKLCKEDIHFPEDGDVNERFKSNVEWVEKAMAIKSISHARGENSKE